ncbi:MAG: thioredoxin family protein [Pseudomonadota bacterium]
MLLGSEACDFGAPAPAFELSTPDGAQHSLDSLMGEKGLLIAFICNHCPYVIALIDRLAADLDVLAAAGVGGVAIMPNDYRAYPADAPDRMTAFAQAHGLNVPYLVDADQHVARAYGAVCTPDFFGFDGQGGLQYRGRLDDTGMHGDPSQRRPELVEAMLQVADTGNGPQQQTASMGCSIKWR